MINTDLLIPGMLISDTNMGYIYEFDRKDYTDSGDTVSFFYRVSPSIEDWETAIDPSKMQPIPLTADILRDWFGCIPDEKIQTKLHICVPVFGSYEIREEVDRWVITREGCVIGIVRFVNNFQLFAIFAGLPHRVPWNRIRQGGNP